MLFGEQRFSRHQGGFDQRFFFRLSYGVTLYFARCLNDVLSRYPSFQRFPGGQCCSQMRQLGSCGVFRRDGAQVQRDDVDIVAMDVILRVEDENPAGFEGAPHWRDKGEKGVTDDFEIVRRWNGKVGELIS